MPFVLSIATPLPGCEGFPFYHRLSPSLCTAYLDSLVIIQNPTFHTSHGHSELNNYRVYPHRIFWSNFTLRLSGLVHPDTELPDISFPSSSSTFFPMWRNINAEQTARSEKDGQFWLRFSCGSAKFVDPNPALVFLSNFNRLMGEQGSPPATWTRQALLWSLKKFPVKRGKIGHGEIIQIVKDNPYKIEILSDSAAFETYEASFPLRRRNKIT